MPVTFEQVGVMNSIDGGAFRGFALGVIAVDGVDHQQAREGRMHGQAAEAPVVDVGMLRVERSPLIMDGDLRHLDAPSMALLTNPEALAPHASALLRLTA